MIILVLTPAYAQETKTTAKEETKDCDQHSEQWFFCTHQGKEREQTGEDKQRPQKDFIYMFMDIGSTYLPWGAWQVEMSVLSKCKDTHFYHLWNKITFQPRTEGWRTVALMYQLKKLLDKNLGF